MYYKLIILCNTNNDEDNTATDFKDNTAFLRVHRLSELSKSISSKDINSLLSVVIKGLKGINFNYYIKIKNNYDISNNNTIVNRR